MLTLPGLIDIHVHLRDPGQTHKEDFYTGTSAALSGGFTTILDMPNNATPITTTERLSEKMQIAREKIVCDIGFYFGSLGNNLEEFKKIQSKVMGIKLYLNHTTGNYLINADILEKVYKAWPGPQPILTHAEENTLAEVIKAIKKYNKPTHICHVSSENELSQILKAKKDKLPITCGACPHHLFLTKDDVSALGPFAWMKPSLKTKKDVEFLWKNFQYIDVVESDHAPHTLEEKQSADPPFGVPGLETTLSLLLTAAHEKRLTVDRIIELCFTNPIKIFNVPTDKNTRVEVDEKTEYIITKDRLKTKCSWSPFENMKVRGEVRRVFLRGKKVFENGEILAKAGTGKIIRRTKV